MAAAMQSLCDEYLSRRDRFALAREAASLQFNATVRRALDRLLAKGITAARYAKYVKAHADAVSLWRAATKAERIAHRANTGASFTGRSDSDG